MEEGNPNTLPSDIIRDIIPYKSLLIIATQNGVCLFDPANGQCQQLFKDSKEGKSIKMVADVTFDSEVHYGLLPLEKEYSVIVLTPAN